MDAVALYPAVHDTRCSILHRPVVACPCAGHQRHKRRPSHESMRVPPLLLSARALRVRSYHSSYGSHRPPGHHVSSLLRHCPSPAWSGMRPYVIGGEGQGLPDDACVSWRPVMMYALGVKALHDAYTPEREGRGAKCMIDTTDHQAAHVHDYRPPPTSRAALCALDAGRGRLDNSSSNTATPLLAASPFSLSSPLCVNMHARNEREGRRAEWRSNACCCLVGSSLYTAAQGRARQGGWDSHDVREREVEFRIQ